ncbi:hypothetical protein HUS62_22180, partial [Pseudoalteromonas sp. 0303]|nr:hypothetical protein [Pseudoalteromonas sp. 0303]
MENISKAVVIVELLSDVWVVMDNGDWVKVDSIPEQLADLPVLNSSDIALEGNELVFSEASEQLVVPQDIISQLVSDLSQNSTFDARSNTSSVTSLSSSDANEAQVAYQLIARQGQELVPESGYETTPTETTEEEDPNFIEFRPDTARDTVEIDKLADITTNIDKTADGVINGSGESAAIVVRGTVEDVEDGQIVTVTISDGVNPAVTTTATVINGEYVTTPIDASALNDGTLTATASVSDVAGNPISAQDSVELDNTAAITTSIDKTADGVINGNGESAAMVVRGTVSDVEDGQTVTVIISDGTNQVETTALVQNGEYVTDPIDASALNDGTLTATASVSDLAGNPVNAQDSVELDNTAVITTSIDKTTDGVINGNGESAAMVVRGTVSDVEDGQTVTVIISDGTNQVETTALVQNGEYVTDPIDASALNDGTLTASASVSDVAGNPISAQDAVELDNTAAITTSIDKTADGVINGNGESAAMVVRGTVSDVEDGQTVTVIIS